MLAAMSCARCKHLDDEITITMPIHLRAAIALAADNVDAGVIKLIEGDIDFPFERASKEAPLGKDSWSDITYHRFACTSCGQRFKLAAETYHGRGGAWEAE
jgi:hypothetical protein